MYDVFISYSRNDTKVVDSICEELKNNNISFFIDRADISGGVEFHEVLVDAIEKSCVFLFVGSKNSYESKYVLNEVTYVYNLKGTKSIIPYLIDDTPLPKSLQFLFCSINYRTMSAHPVKTFLINDIKSMLRSDAGNDIPKTIIYKDDYKFHAASDLNRARRHWIVTACAMLQIVLLSLLCYAFFFLFCKGFVATPPHHTLWWTNVVLIMSFVLSIAATGFILGNMKKAFYAICLLDVLQSICISILGYGIHMKSYDYQYKIYSILSSLGSLQVNQPFTYFMIVLLSVVMHCYVMYSVLQIKKGNVPAWSLLR